MASPKGDAEAIKKAIDLSQDNDGDALVILGDLTHGETDSKTVKETFGEIGKSTNISYYIPGANDYPIDTYLREAYNIELIYPTRIYDF